MDNKEKKRIMTELAAGHITQEAADKLTERSSSKKKKGGKGKSHRTT